MSKVQFRASRLRAALRMGHWVVAALAYWFAVLYDRLHGRKGVAHRAVRLRQAFERMGATFIKIGQQLAMRIDLLPYEYCTELGKMLDHVPPFPTEQAIAAIEAATGKPLEETFASFDPEPIGAASVACVYQAYLLDGSHVAVKVRRPGIGQAFAADLRALDWLLRLIEWLTLIKPGMTMYLRSDLRNMLMEELDLRKEARYQWLFRKYARKHKQRYVTAPRIYPGLSNDQVLIQEFVSGIWLSELLAAVETDNQELLTRYAEMGIVPRKVARNILQTSYWSIQECPFFHADPHPANVVIQQGSKLVLIDFGACGPSPLKSRRGNSEIFRCLTAQDVAGAVRAAISMLEPMPFIDVDELISRTELVWREQFYAMKYKHSPWWKRTTATLWLGFLEVVRDYNIPVTMDSLRIMRSSLLYDTLAARLDPGGASMLKEFGRYLKRRRRRLGKKFRDQLDVPMPQKVLRDVASRYDDLAHLGGRLLFRLDRFADLRATRYYALASKASFVATLLIKMFAQLTFVTATALGGIFLYDYVEHTPFDTIRAFRHIVLHPAYVAFVALTTVRMVRRVLFRLYDSDWD